MAGRRWRGLAAMLVPGLPPGRRSADVPKTYEAALDRLDVCLSPTEKAALRAADGPTRVHFGLGLFIRNDWGLWREGALARFMRAAGLSHPDDMAATILDGYVARLRDQAFDVAVAAGAASRLAVPGGGRGRYAEDDAPYAMSRGD